MNQQPRIESRQPSRFVLWSRSTPHGSALLGFRDPSLGFLNTEEDEFCPAREVLEVFGSLESWLAYVLLKRCAGCRTEVKH